MEATMVANMAVVIRSSVKAALREQEARQSKLQQQARAFSWLCEHVYNHIYILECGANARSICFLCGIMYQFVGITIYKMTFLFFDMINASYYYGPRT